MIIIMIRIKWRSPFIHIEKLSAGAVLSKNDKKKWNPQCINFISDARWSIENLNVATTHLAQWIKTNRQNST